MTVITLLCDLVGNVPLVECIQVELQSETASTKKNLRTGSVTLQSMVCDELGYPSWCYKRKRNGLPSTVLKVSLTLIREGVAAEVKELPFSVDLLVNVCTVLNEVRMTLFSPFKKLESEFVDKFFKFQLQNDILSLPAAREVSLAAGLEHYEWIRTTMTRLRKTYNVSLNTRLAQQTRTNENRTRGLEAPLMITNDGCAVVIAELTTTFLNESASSDIRIASALCLLQLACGGRARDVVLVNVVTPEDDVMVRVKNITKRKWDGKQFEIVKPVLTSVFPFFNEETPSFRFTNLLCVTRKLLIESEIEQGTLQSDWIKTTDTVCGPCLSLDYEKQWLKDTSIEKVVSRWSAKMRQVLTRVCKRTKNETIIRLFSKGKGTHQLRKMYVVCSYQQTGSAMKEPAWAQRVLGHQGYETSLLYMNMVLHE